MTIREIIESDKDYLTPLEISEVFGADPQVIRAQARKDPSKLGFPVVVMGSRTKIPRKQFIKFMEE